MPKRNALAASPKRPRVHRVVMLAYADAQVLDITGPLEVFARTSRWLRDHRALRVPAYEIELVAPSAGAFATSGGLRLVAERSFRDVERIDTLLLAGGIGYEAVTHNREVIRWIQRKARTVERVGSICTGAFVLAACGLLDHKSATTHWAYCDRLARAVPGCDVNADALYVRNGNIYTSAGVTAGMDMALAMVEEDWGKAVALAVAQELVMFLKRPGGQSQFSRYLQAQQREDRFGKLQLWVLEHLDGELSVERLAQMAGLSVRHFSRQFHTTVGVSPAAFVQRVRVEEARRCIEDGADRLKGVARRCGFQDEQSLRRAFRRALGVTPAEYRTRFASSGAA
jgi:transcriptional regulator GlxA family with amidase domain